MEEILHQAAQSEKEYDWSGAAGSYEKALTLLPRDDFSKMGEIHERLGYAFYRFAFQAESKDEFRQRLRQAVANYEKASELYQKLNEPKKTGIALRCDAMNAFMGYWLASDVPEKKRVLNECWRLTKEALKSFEQTGKTSQCGRTYNQLSSSVVFGFAFEWDFQTRKTMIKEAVEHGEQTIKSLSSNEDSLELARAYARTALYLEVFALYFLDADEKKTNYQKARDYRARAKEISEDVVLSELTWPIFGSEGVFWGGAADEAVPNLTKALEYGRKTKEKFTIGCALDWLAYHTAYKTSASQDPDERLRLHEAILQYAEDAKRHYFPISFTSPRDDDYWVEDVDTNNLLFQTGHEADVKKKQALLEKAIVAAREGLKRAEASGYIEVIMMEHGLFHQVLTGLAQLEKRAEERKAILREAMKHAEESTRIMENIKPFDYWDRANCQGTLARIRRLLSELARNTPEEKNLIQGALLNLENATRLGLAELSMTQSMSGTGAMVFFSAAGNSRYMIGRYFNRLYEITSDREFLRKALEAFANAVEYYQKIDLRSRIAECRWKAATTYDLLGEHLKAADDFALASENYKNAAGNIPQLKDLYQDQASYMLAWTEIEKARDHHERQEHDLAKEHFEKAANIHKSLKQWSYLAPNYFAWTQLEQAEELSRKEQTEEAAEAFENAVNLFTETQKSLRTRLDKIEDFDEKQMATNMVTATDIRRDYCMARMSLEEARVLDKKGDHYRSSEKYGSVVEALEKIIQALQSEKERKEFKQIMVLSKAWQKMTLAEAEASPPLYAEASKLFEEAKEFSPNEKTKMLLLGHSRFCKALEAGTEFADTRNMDMYFEAVKYLESAANYYVKAGFPKASEYSEATRLLFDAYTHIDRAAREVDPEKKVKLYAMADKVLQTSAGSFMKAEHPEKREQVLELIEKVKKEQEVATSLMEVLHASAIVSSTTSFSTPAPTCEQAVGSERFEHADIQANLIVRKKELKVGELLNLEIEFVNAGKGPALLIKVNEVMPEGFELGEKPEIYRVEDSYIDMKGKRLGPLKTEELRLVLKPKVQGTFALKPTILYLDENGKYKSYEPESVTIIVKELGIKGWLKGER
ncbi:MAG TPA: hypothetical protein VMT01_01420 [Candidatus Acidoferrum sp.]|nr:hypothetical protein [Candidatus Acidoferrum sp.]